MRSSKKQDANRKVAETIEMYEGSSNIFKDIGFGTEEAANLLVRSQLISEIERIIKKKGWTQVQAAKALRVVQPRISELMSSRIDRFSVDILLKYLARLGKQVTVTVEDFKPGRTVHVRLSSEPKRVTRRRA